MKGLEDIISYDVVDWYMGPNGWRFNNAEHSAKDATEDSLNHSEYIREIYFKQNPEYDGRFTVPVLYDKKTGTIVNNESSEIIRMFYTEFDDFIEEKYRGLNFYPEKYQKQIDGLNEWIYNDINNGVYKSGFATAQEVYDKNVTQLFKSLDRVEEILKESAKKINDPSKPFFLLGEEFTEADLRLYPTIARFDPVYVQHFKCNIRDIRYGYPYIHTWLRHLYWDVPAFHDTTNFDHIKYHYTKSHVKYNPTGVTPAGPVPHILPKDSQKPAL